MATSLAEQTENPTNLPTYSQIISGLGAVGIALQNYPAVVIFINSLTKNIIPVSQVSTALIHTSALTTGGIASGMVNFWMNVELLDGFFKRMTEKNDEGNYKYIREYQKLTAWEQLQYFSGIAVFVVTGILFGLMAFAFAMEGPLALLSVVAGVLVAGIMTIQEVETWLQSYDKLFQSRDPKNQEVMQEDGEETSLDHWQLVGKYCGHLIAAGNVLALSLLFTLGLTQSLMILQIALLPALITGFTIAFTFGAFTEYFFYNAYLADFCKDFGKNWEKMLAIKHAWAGIACISTNALVNAALTYAGVELLTGVLVAASITLPPVAAITALAAISAFFGGTASFILGTAFWIRQNESKPQPKPVITSEGSAGLKRYSNWTKESAANRDLEVQHHLPTNSAVS
ncbi:MAG: hypothetical protein KBB94_04725 [Legionellaceae bacterium]|nr:hypothetical protein [Legionellaceae bacterium]MBP9774553.1 hypothetical protein [Legionellaceae bacterium]